MSAKEFAKGRGKASALPAGVVRAGGANISVPMVKSLAATSAKLEGHRQYLVGAVNAPPTTIAYEKSEAKEMSRRATLRSETMSKYPGGISPEEHLKAAMGHMSAANAARSTGGSGQLVHEHVAAAKAHVVAAGGGYWDESKHPRDSDGKFT